MAACGVATPAGAVAARALSDEGDDPGLTDRVGPPVSKREAMAESDKQREGGDGRIRQAARWRRRPNRTSSEKEVTAKLDKRSRPIAKISKEMTWAIKVDRAKLTMGCGKFFSKFSNKDLGF
jgi:hypothetical protein